MALPLAAIGAGAALAAGGIIRGAQVGALDEGPEYIRDGDPASPIDAIGLFAARQACKVYANNPDAINDRPAAAYERVCRPFLDNIGYSEGPSAKIPFRGGQCPAVRYNVVVQWRNFNNQIETIGRSGFGPIGGFALGESFNGLQPLFVRFKLADGVTESLVVVNTVSTSIPPEPTFLSISRDDALPDDCGNPEPIYIEPGPPDEPETGPRPFVFAPDFDIDVNVDVDIDGRISVDIGTGPIVIDPFADGEDGGEGGGGDGPPSTPAPEPGPELPGGNGGFGGDDQFGEPPAGRRWVGCCIRITQRPTNQPPIPGTVPEDVYPSVVGNIRLVCNAAGNRVVDTPVRILAKHVCVWEPVAKLNPTGVNVDLFPGFGYVFTPYSVPLED